MIADQRRRLNERSRIGMCSGDLKFDTNGIEMTIQRLDGVQYERLFFRTTADEEEGWNTQKI